MKIHTFTQDASRIGLTILQEYIEDGEKFHYPKASNIIYQRRGNDRWISMDRNSFRLCVSNFWFDSLAYNCWQATIVE